MKIERQPRGCWACRCPNRPASWAVRFITPLHPPFAARCKRSRAEPRVVQRTGRRMPEFGRTRIAQGETP